MKILKSENFLIFLVVFFLAVSAGIYINFVTNFIFVDAFKRSFMAYLVFYGNEPKFSAIGFVWPPLPTLLQLPLVLFEPLNQTGIAGNILSSIFLGISTVYVNLLATLFSVKKLFRYIILFLFITNPLIFFYGSNGMSEMVAIGFMIMTIYYFLRHVTLNSLPSLMVASLTLTCAILTRWEMGTLLFLILLLIAYIPFVNKKYTFREAESSAVIFSVPILFATFLWLLTSWLIVGSPTYFLNSPYSFTAHDAKQLAGNSVLNAAGGNLILSLMFVLERIVYLSVVFFPLFILVLARLRKQSERLNALGLLGFALCIVFAHTMLLFIGKSYGELRYFIYVIPFSYIFLLFLFKNTHDIPIKKYTTSIFFAFSAISVLISSGLTYFAMSEPKYGNQEHVLINVLKDEHDEQVSYSFEKEAQIANYICSNVQSRSVLVDDSVGFIIIYLTRNPHLFIETVDRDFKQTLDNPLQSDAKYILISDQESHSGIDILDSTYPMMFKDGADFVTLEKDFGDWKLYKIDSQEEKTEESQETISSENNCKNLKA